MRHKNTVFPNNNLKESFRQSKQKSTQGNGRKWKGSDVRAHIFLDRSLGDEAVDERPLSLALSVDAVDGLQLESRIHDGLHKDNAARSVKR